MIGFGWSDGKKDTKKAKKMVKQGWCDHPGKVLEPKKTQKTAKRMENLIATISAIIIISQYQYP